MFNFDMSNGFVLLRIIVALFLIPHAVAKITMRQGSLGFFTAAGYPSPGLFVNFGIVFEFVIAAALILGVYTQIAAWLTVFYMLVATASVYKVAQGKWLWNIGGCEYPLFWGLCAAIVAMNPT
jgi:putative oxidoreductase